MGGGVDGHASRVVLLGPPGAGKGTQAQVLSGRLRVPAISTGDLLREAMAAESELGRRVRGSVAGGKLVEDGVMAEVVRERLEQPDARRGFLLDGYPRTLPQADTLEEILRGTGQKLDTVLLLDVPEEVLLPRALLRKRPDDTEEVIRKRFEEYREKTVPLIGYYRGRGLLREIDGNRPIEEVTARLLDVFGVA